MVAAPVYNHILSDLDGTLADTFPRLHACALQALQHFGITVDDPDMGYLRANTGRGAAVLLAILANSQEVPQACLDLMLEYYGRDPVTQTVLFPGVANWFSAFPVGVVTNKPRRFAEPIINALCPAGTLLVCPEDAGAAKPDPAMLQYALARLECAAQDAVYVGDDQRDLEAARAAGIDFVAAAYGYGYRPDMAVDAVGVLKDPEDLLHVVHVQ